MQETTLVRPYVQRADEGRALWLLGKLATVKAGGSGTRDRLTVLESVSPPAFARPMHRRPNEDELFYILSGTATYHCHGESFQAGPGDFVFLPAGLAHTFTVGPDKPLRKLQITTPSGFEQFAAAVGEPASERRLPDSGPVDATALDRAAARHAIEILAQPTSTDP
ncbi:MAG: cupin domain-containing protein [Streptosporangiaceae bacterium]